ncbi:MAG: hypothetical protein M3R52_07715 [Acidobacteriota bacterium]|nr:hypothetical protein [Acidobacteriota bacterium]
MAQSVFERIREEIANTQKQRYQFYVLKISFVTALLGFGAFRVQEISSYYPVLYLVPLVSVFFDFLIMGEHISIRRLGTFLRLHSNEPEERDFEVFVTKNRDKFITIGLLGFTLLTWIAAFSLLRVAKSKGGSSVGTDEIVWFVGILIAFVVAVYYAIRRLNDLDKK